MEIISSSTRQRKGHTPVREVHNEITYISDLAISSAYAVHAALGAAGHV